MRSQIVMGQHYKQTQQITLTEAFGKYWLERARFTNSKASTKSHIQHIMKHLGEQTPLHEIDQATLSSYVAKCRAETYQKIAPGSENKGKATITSNATINRRIACFQGMHNDARVVWEIQVKNIDFKRLKLKEPPPINNTMKKNQLQAWMDGAPEHLRHYTMFAIYSGLRKSNILGLRGRQIDIDGKIIKTIGKGNKQIHVPIVDALLHYIILHELHKAERAITYLGKPIKDIRTSWKKRCKETGMTGFRRHDMRHTCATWIYEATGDLLAVKEHLHHADLKTSMRYTHTKKDEQLKKLNKAFESAGKNVKIVK